MKSCLYRIAGFAIIAAICLVALFSCGNGGYRVAKITHGANEKNVEVCWGDSALRDTSFIVPAAVPDSVILKNLKAIEDSLKYEKFKLDSLRAIFVADSLYKEFQQDSINFRKITKKINGGYNGWDYRYKLWLNARKVIEQSANSDTH
jgi:hypothetical protein